MNHLANQIIFAPETTRLVTDHEWARALYSTLCNGTFWSEAHDGVCVIFDWREAQATVQAARDVARCARPTYEPNIAGEPYIYWHKLTDEDRRRPEIVTFLLQFGWMTT